MIFRYSVLVLALAFIGGPAMADQLPCGQLQEGYKGEVPVWPNEPVDFDCKRGITELALCIFNREGIEWLPNAGPQFVAIADGNTVYAMTRENHPAYPMVVKRSPIVEEGEVVSLQSQGCGYGDKAASDKLMAQYRAMDEKIAADAKKESEQ